MADNDQNNDEYKFAELDSLDSDSMGDHDSGLGTTKSYGQGDPAPKKDVKRNALIAVGLIVFAMLAYKLIGGMFSGKRSAEPATQSIPSIPATEVVPQTQPQPIMPTPQPQSQPIRQEQPIAQESNFVLKQKVESIESNQQNMQTQVTSLSEQVSTVNNNVNSLSNQINKLNQVISDLSTQVSKQSEEIGALMVRTQPKPVRRTPPSRRHVGQANVYYINAVIPGRAWLISTNGSTLTVREGTRIAGYGVVKLIDSMAGRILTSSGRTIRFSQEDS